MIANKRDLLAIYILLPFFVISALTNLLGMIGCGLSESVPFPSGELPDCAGNSTPRAQAGPPLTAAIGEVVELNALSSSDPDGDPLGYTWSRVSGPSGEMDNAHQAEASFVAHSEGNYVFSLMVNDGCSTDIATTQLHVSESAANGKEDEIVEVDQNSSKEPDVPLEDDAGSSLEEQPQDADDHPDDPELTEEEDVVNESSPIQIISEWASGSAAVYGQLIWTLPSGDQIQRSPWYNEAPDGSSIISEVIERATDGIHQITFSLSGPAASSADITLYIRFLDYHYLVTRGGMSPGTTHTIQLEIVNRCVTELANSWRLEHLESLDVPGPCNNADRIRAASTWANATSPVYGELYWTLPSGDQIKRVRYYNEVQNGGSALSEVVDRATEGIHHFTFHLGGDPLALADIEVHIQFLDYEFQVRRLRITGLTWHSIHLEVRNGCVTELANTWKFEQPLSCFSRNWRNPSFGLHL